MKKCNYPNCVAQANKELEFSGVWRSMCFEHAGKLVFWMNKKRPYLYLIEGGKYGEGQIGPFMKRTKNMNQIDDNTDGSNNAS